jgi:hypothetical protein
MKKDPVKAARRKRPPVTAEESNELFRKMIDACGRLMVDPLVVVHCHAYRDRDSTARRVIVIRELLKNGFSLEPTAARCTEKVEG